MVLRGSGSDTDGTLINVTGDPRNVFVIGTASNYIKQGTEVKVAQKYVPSGAQQLTLSDTSPFTAGDNIIVSRPVTKSWVHYMGMDNITWLDVGSELYTDRHVVAINGNTITLDAPMSDSIDSVYLSPPGATVSRYSV